MTNAEPPCAALYPSLRYADPNAAMAYLRAAFEFAEHSVDRAADGGVDRAVLRAGRGFIVLGDRSADERRYRTPQELGGTATGSCYVGTPDVERRYAAARAAGALIVCDLTATDDGSLDFSACDLEGFLWSFGTYRPSADPHRWPDVYAVLNYRDTGAAGTWLERTLGFRVHQVGPAGGAGAHVQAVYGTSLVMLQTSSQDALAMRPPRDIGGDYTLASNVYVTDADAAYRRAVDAGANVTAPLASSAEGSRGFTVCDPEGHCWEATTYRPSDAPMVESTLAATRRA